MSEKRVEFFVCIDLDKESYFIDVFSKNFIVINFSLTIIRVYDMIGEKNDGMIRQNHCCFQSS